MSGPVLLVHDDIAAIATVRRLLGRQGLETILATSAADALIAYGHYQPSLLVLATGVEGGRGPVVLQELALHPESARARVVLLGAPVEGSNAVAIPLPLDGASFLEAVNATLAAEPSIDAWRVQEPGWDAHRAQLADAEEIEAEDPGAPTAPHLVLEGTPELSLEADYEPTLPAFTAPPEAALPEAAPFANAEAEVEKQRAVEAARALGAFEATETMRREIDVREAELAQREGALRRVEESLLQTEDERDRLRAELAARDAALAAKDAELERLTAARTEELRELNAELEAARGKRLAVSAERDQAVERGRALEEDVEALRRSIAGLEQALEELEAERERAEKDAEEAKADAQRAQGLLKSSLEEREAEAHAQLERLERELAEARALTAETEQRLQEAHAATEALVAGHAELEHSAAGDREAREALSARLVEAERARDEAQAQLASREEALAQAEARAGSLEEALAESEAAKRAFEERLQEGTQAADALSVRHEELEGALTDARDEADRLAARLAAAEGRVGELAPQLERALKDVEGAGAERASAAAEGAAYRERAEQAEAATAELRESLEVLDGRYALLQRELERARRSESELEKRLETLRAQSQETVEGLRAYAEPLAARIAELDAEVEETRAALAEAQTGAEEAAAALQAQLEALRVARAEREGELTARLEAAEKSRAEREAELTAQLEALQVARAERETELTAQLEAAETARAEREAELTAQLEAAETARAEREAELTARLQAAEAAREAELTAQAEAAETVRAAREAELTAQLEAAEAARGAREAELTAQAEALEAVRAEVAEAKARAMSLEKALEERGAAVAAAEAEAQRLAEQIQRTLVPLTGPGRENWTLAQTGSLDAVGLARMGRKLALADAEVRLELKSDALRVLWVRGGKLVAASSAHDEEWLGASAHREGLIDGRQLRELALVRAGTDRAVLEGMRSRGWIRDAEVAPLIRRHFERIALEALSADDTRYHLVPAQTPEDTLVAAGERPLAQLLTEALRRALPHGRPGTEPFRCAPRLLGRPDFEWFGFSPQERSLLEALDGTTAVQAHLLATGIRTELALRALALAEALELVEVGPPVADAELPPPPEVEVQRLAAKWKEISEADYFSVLGLSRGAGAPEVERAFRALSEEFHPLRYVGHPDARWRVRAEALQGVLKEAALALADDRLRAEYARNLTE